jgi:hypothetical protein
MRTGCGKLLAGAFCLVGVLITGIAGDAVTLDDVTITLQSHGYYKNWDMTRFVYRVRSTAGAVPAYWVLGTGGCIPEERIDEASSSPFEWTADPVVGLRFACASWNERFTVWLFGRWDVGSVEVAVVGSMGQVQRGVMEGPSCGVSAISLEIVRGASVEFPQIVGAGTFRSTDETRLRVSSTMPGWNLGHGITFLIPATAQLAVVERIFHVDVRAYASVAGVTEVDVSYELRVSDEDFSGLPEGTYLIGVVYTVNAED